MVPITLKEFRGILILDRKEKRPSVQTLKDLRELGFVVIFLENVDHYRLVGANAVVDLNGNARVMLQEFLNADRMWTKDTILRMFGKAVAGQLKSAVLPISEVENPENSQ